MIIKEMIENLKNGSKKFQYVGKNINIHRFDLKVFF
jgi:hypothetical protein